MKRIKVKLNYRKIYEILIGQNLFDKTGEIIKSKKIGNDIFIITDSKVASLYLGRIIENLKKSGFPSVSYGIIEEGEENKSFKNYEILLRKIHQFDKNLDKNIVVICLGGGVVGDIGGFVSGTYRRGVKLVQIPTTLLAQVDSGIGGKVAINLEKAKNIVGMFYQPEIVIIDPLLLKTLDKRELCSGLAEVVKYGIIEEPYLLDLIEKNIEKILSLSDMDLIEEIIEISLNIKRKIIEKDERDEKDIRIVLNLGHTIGHAIESAAEYKFYKHGEALSIGIMAEFEISEKLGILKDEKLKERIENLFKIIGLPVKKDLKCKDEDIIESMKYDKKFLNGKNRFVLPVKCGETKIVEGVDEKVIKDVLKEITMQNPIDKRKNNVKIKN